jgi:hypothetical protein
MKHPPLLTRVDLEIRSICNWERENGKKWPYAIDDAYKISHACVNFLKHEWWRYDKTIAARKMTDKEYIEWFIKITGEIKKQYPWLRNAVKQQIYHKKERLKRRQEVSCVD